MRFYLCRTNEHEINHGELKTLHFNEIESATRSGLVNYILRIHHMNYMNLYYYNKMQI